MGDNYTPEERSAFLREFRAADPAGHTRLKRATFKDMITYLPDLQDQKQLRALVDAGEFDDVGFKAMRGELFERGAPMEDLKEAFRMYVDEQMDKPRGPASPPLAKTAREFNAEKYISGNILEQLTERVPADVVNQIDRIQNAENRVLSLEELRSIASKNMSEKDFATMARDAISQYEAQSGQKAPDAIRRSFPAPLQQFGVMQQMSAPVQQSAPMVQRSESITNVAGKSSQLPEYMRETPRTIHSSSPPPASRTTSLAAGFEDGGKMENEARKLGGFLDDYPKIKRVIEGVPLGLRYGAATLPAAALLTKYALDEADDIGERWTKNRLRAEMRKDALRKLAYHELKNAKVSPVEEPRQNFYTSSSRY